MIHWYTEGIGEELLSLQIADATCIYQIIVDYQTNIIDGSLKQYMGVS